MGDPQIRGIVVDPPVVQPGGSATVTVDAFDPDEATVTIQVTVRDSAGHEMTGAAEIGVTDPLIYQATADRGSLTQDPTDSRVFRWTDA